MSSGPGPYVISCRYTGFSETQTLLGPKKRAGSITPWRSFLSHYWDAGRVHPISTTSLIFAAPFLGVRCYVAGRMLFYLRMPIPGVVMHRRVHLGAKQQDRRRDVKIKEQREGDAQAAVDHTVVGEVRQVKRETQRG